MCLFHPVVREPGGERGLLMLPEMPLQCADVDAAEPRDRSRFVLRQAGDVTPGQFGNRSGKVIEGSAAILDC